MRKIATLLYGTACYLLFLAVFVYLIGFLGNFVVPVSIDVGPETPIGPALSIDLALIALFGLQHTVMARGHFKDQWTKIVSPAIERSTFVLAASVALVLLVWQWRPVPVTVWHVENAVGRLLLWGLFWLGWLIVLVSTFQIDHFDLFGLRQVYHRWQGRDYMPPDFITPALYRYVRHPMMTGLLLAFWATPEMTVGHLVFAGGMTVYMLVGIRFEERDLVRHFGDRYREYRRSTPMLVPTPTPEGGTRRQIEEPAS